MSDTFEQHIINLLSGDDPEITGGEFKKFELQIQGGGLVFNIKHKPKVLITLKSILNQLVDTVDMDNT